MQNADAILGLNPVPETLAGYTRLQPDNPRVAHNGQWSPGAAESPEVEQNLPGRATGEFTNGTSYGFNSLNLHFHGLEVEPHLFVPEATQDPKAPWVTIAPTNDGTRCYCYNIHLSQGQSVGTFLYHIHRHGSSAYQGWSGMVGLIKVVEATPEATAAGLDGVLKELGVVGDQPFV